MCVPGIKIVSPSNPADVKGLLASAIRDDDPVLFFEQKALFGVKGDVPDGDYSVPLGEAAVRRKGSDITLIGLGATVSLCIEAAGQLSESEIDATVIDLRTLVPLDAAAILESVERTGRVMIVEENPGQLGWGAGVAAIVAEEAFYDLDAPVARVSGVNVPLPFAADLEKAALPSTTRVLDSARKLMEM